MHDCFEGLNKRLEAKNTQLSFAMQIPSGEEMLVIATEPIKKLRNGQKPVRVMATYCPFCGKHLAPTHYGS